MNKKTLVHRSKQTDQVSLCILHWDLNHVVALKGVSRSLAVIHDPSVGVRRLSMADFSKPFTGVALELTLTGGLALA